MPSSTFTATYVFRSPYIFSSPWSRITHSMINQWGVVWGHAGCEIFFAGVLIELFWCEIYSAKSIPYPGHPYGSCSCWGMWRQAPWIMQEYELVNPATYMWKDLSSFSAMSRLKFVSMTSASFPSMQSTDRTNGEKMFPLWVIVLTTFIFVLLLPFIQELFHSLLPVGVCVQLSKSDVDYVISMDFP